MITLDKRNKQIQLNMCILKTDNHYIYWRQNIRYNGVIIDIGYFTGWERHSKGWNKTMRDRIIKVNLGGKK